MFFKCPPTASTVGTASASTCSPIGSGAKPRARRKHLRTVGPDADDRIVHRPHDRPIVGQQHVGDRAQSAARASLDRDRHRLLGEIAAGANQRPRDGRHQQVVQRRVGQHHAQIRIAGGDAGNGGEERAERVQQRETGTPPQQDDRRLARRATRASSSETWQCRRTSSRATEHQGKRPVGPVLSPPQPGHGRGVGRIHQQLKSAQPLQGHDPARRAAIVPSPSRAASAGGRFLALGGRAVAASARSAGRRSAGRESADRPDRRTRPGSRGTSGTRPSRSAAGRRAIAR